MDGNKDEALRCIRIAKSALASGDKDRALKFIKIAQRLDGSLSFDDLLSACEGLDCRPSASSTGEKPVDEKIVEDTAPKEATNYANGDRNYTDENVELIREVKRHKDYYAVLGVEKNCTVEEIRKAYRKLSLKVHPDKNKAPGSEEAFKMVSKAFKCLSDEQSRRQYDQTGLVEDFEYNQHYNVRRRRRRTRNDIFDDNIDPEEIFRSFFFGSQQEVFRNAHVYRSRGMGTQRGDAVGSGFNLVALLQILPILVIFLIAYLPFSEPDYSLHKTYSYEIPKVTEKYGVEYFVKTSAFDQQFPPGSPSRANIEKQVVREYRTMLGRFCHLEMQRRQWVRNYPTPHCDKLQNFGIA